MKKIVMLLALAVAFSLSGFAQASGSTSSSGGASSSDTGTTSTKKSSKKAASSDTSSTDAGAKSGGKSSTVTGCLKSDSTPVTLTNGKYKNGVQVDTSGASGEDWAKHNGHKVQLTGSWSGTGADKQFKATGMKHVAATCTAGGKASAAGDKKGKSKKDAGDASKSPSK